jgi:hypothetical protein
MLTEAADGGKAAEDDRNRSCPAGTLEDPHRVVGGARRGIRRRDALVGGSPSELSFGVAMPANRADLLCPVLSGRHRERSDATSR